MKKQRKFNISPFLPFLINTASQNLPVPRAQQAEVLLKYNVKHSDYFTDEEARASPSTGFWKGGF